MFFYSDDIRGANYAMCHTEVFILKIREILMHVVLNMQKFVKVQPKH